MQPDTHYARSADGVRIAYQVIGGLEEPWRLFAATI